MSKKLLMIISRSLWPIDCGRKTSLNYYCKGLHEQFGYDIYLYSFSENGKPYEGEIPSYIKEVRYATPINKQTKLLNILKYSLIIKKWPFQCSFFYDKKNLNAIEKFFNEVQPDVFFTEMIRTAPYIKVCQDKNVITIANLDDLLSKRYNRQLKAKDSKANILGDYSKQVSKANNRLATNKFFRHIALSTEAKRCAIWEKKFYNMYRYSLFTSPKETREINDLMGQQKAFTLSVGCDCELFSRNLENDKKEENSISFIGNFNVPANIDTLNMICENILPKVHHTYKFYIVGVCPKEYILKYENDINLIFCGRVEDIVEVIKRTQIFISPIAYGTGIKTKIIEAMAMGMPIITNSVGAEGIDAVNNKDFIVEDDYKKLARHLDDLLENPEKRNALGKNAQAFAYENFRWSKVLSVFHTLGL